MGALHRRSTSAALALACAATAAPAQTYVFQAETGTRTGTVISTGASGYTGTGFVTQFDSANDKVTVNATNVPPGLYELWVRYRSPNGKKGYDVQVNAERGSGWFDTRSTFGYDRAGLFNITAGTNPLSIIQGWGYYDIDSVELRASSVRPISPVSSNLVDSQASPNTHALMNYLTSIYGTKTLAGQQGAITSAYLSKSGGLRPAMSGADFMDYSPSRVERGSSSTESERMVNWAHQNGGVVSMMWHWNAPSGLIDQPGKEWWRGFYTDATTFDVSAALAQPGSTNYNLLLRDIDAISLQLKKFQDAKVPVLWRPLHEAEGGWFWWGAKGATAFKGLWNLMYDRMTNYHGLHNLIWVYTSSSAEQGFQNWYPGDDKVDIVGLDVYTDRTSSMSGQWLDMLDVYDGRKMITLSETGNLPTAALMKERGTRWSWFNPWSITDVTNNYTAAELQALLGDSDVITLNELPELPWNMQTFLPGDANLNGVIDADDFALTDKGFRLRLSGWNYGDFTGNGVVNSIDLQILYDSAQAQGFAFSPIPEPTTFAACGLAIFALATRRTGRGGTNA